MSVLFDVFDKPNFRPKQNDTISKTVWSEQSLNFFDS